MAELELFSVTGRILESLASEAVKELAYMSGMKDEISKLQQNILAIRAVLLNAEEQQVDNHVIKSWLKRVEDVVYDADDFVDYLSTVAMAKPLQVRTFFSWPSQFVLRLKMGHRIKQINGILHAIYQDRNRMDLNLTTLPAKPLVVTRRTEMTHSYVSEEQVLPLGREGDKEAILKLVLDPIIEEEDDVYVVAIVGSGGVGKTTLAQLVYNDDKVQTHFDLRLWVCVADDYDVRSVVEKIIKSAYDKSTENLEMDQLQMSLWKIINGKRYLLVLDDVWNEDRESWLNLKRVLSNGAQGSRIVITTRSIRAATITSKMEPYGLWMLDEEASWSLFKQVAFKKGQEPETSNIVEIGKEIVNKCGGNPLAIRTIGRMLYFKDSEREWYSFLMMEFTKVQPKEDGIIQTLKLSFDSLPSHLKHCFAYCCIFPKDCEIDVQTLINLWIAQGFIYSSDPRWCMEDVGYEYIEQLTWRSFFQDIQIDKHGIITKFKMPSLIHDLAIMVAGERCSKLSLNKDNIDRKAHHLSFNFHLDSHWQIPTSLVQAKRTRTILLSNQSQLRETEGRSSQSICDMVLGCKTLRVLDLHNLGINIVPSPIGKLKHLRYLDLSRNKNISTLPSSITKLYNLQTLKLNFCQRLKELPRDIKKLINLRNLEIDGCYSLTHMPCGLGQLTNLKTLSEFVLSKRKDLDSRHKGGLDELKNLNNLRGELRIKNLRHGAEYEVANLEEKRLKSLILIWDNDVEAMKAVASGYVQRSKQEMNVDSYLMSLNGLKPQQTLEELSLFAYGGIQFPDWFSSLTNLVRVSLWGCKECQYIPPLHQFSSLAVLTLDELTNLEYISENENNQLSSIAIPPSLKELRLAGLPNLKGWWRPDGSEGVDDISSSTKTTILLTAESYQPFFPFLSKLSIENCPKLDSMPLYPQLDEVLQLHNTSLKPLQQTITMSMAGQQISTTTTDEASSSAISHASVPSTSAFFRLSKLRNLCLVDMMELDFSNGDVINWKAFESLESLTFDHLPQLKTLPEGLQEVNSLQELHIHRCNNLEAIPDWIIKLKSLKKLVFRLLPNLTSLPVELYGLTSLQNLEIEDCPRIALKANPVQHLIMQLLRPPRIIW